MMTRIIEQICLNILKLIIIRICTCKLIFSVLSLQTPNQY